MPTALASSRQALSVATVPASPPRRPDLARRARASGLLVAIALLGAGARSPAQESEHGSPFVLGEAPVVVDGVIEAYRGVFKTGRLSCLDAVTRLPQELVFEIAPDGRFSVELDLLHPVTGSAFLDLEGSYYPLVLEPGGTYDLTVGANGLAIDGPQGETNAELAEYRAKAAGDLGAEQARVDAIHGTDLPAEQALEAYTAFAARRMEHLAAFARATPMGATARRAAELDIAFEAAHAAICYRYTNVGGRRTPRPSLPDDFVATVLERFPVTTTDGFVARPYIDYVANVVEIFERPEEDTVEARIAFYRSQAVFTEQELEMIAGIYRGGEELLASEDFAAFDTPTNQRREFVLRKRYRLHNVLGRVAPLPPGIGRDLIVSQALARNFLAGDLITPTPREWAALGAAIESETVFEVLRREVARRSGQEPAREAETAADEEATSSGDVDAILAVSRGKVVYVDFWATWCAPCRAELPAAERLAREFAGADVVFLNLCAQSRRSDWQQLIAQRELPGVHVFLSDADYRPLADRYGVVGFPSYILIDREGQVVRTNAPRPSSGTEIVTLIRSLLD